MLNYNCSPGGCLWKFFILFKLCIYVFTLIDSYANNHQLNNFPRSNFFFLALQRHITEEGILLLLLRETGEYTDTAWGRGGKKGRVSREKWSHSTFQRLHSQCLYLFSINSLRWICYPRVSEQRFRGIYIITTGFQLGLMELKSSQ